MNDLVEIQVLNKIIRTKDTSILTTNDIGSEFFDVYKDEFLFIKNHIEKYDSVIVRAVQKLEQLELPNLRLIRCDANYIEEIFEKEINTIYLNFSDPWPKARHERRRLTSQEFLKKYDSLFKDKKIIIQKTDNRNLFEFSIKSFTDYGYKIDMISLNLHEDDFIENIETEYEQKFVSRGSLIYKVEVSKD